MTFVTCPMLARSAAPMARISRHSVLACRKCSELTGTFQTPIVAALWKQRQQEKADLDSELISPSAVKERIVKTPADSRVKAQMPFAGDEHLRMTYTSPWGYVRTGRIIEDLDALAGNVVSERIHHSNSNQPKGLPNPNAAR